MDWHPIQGELSNIAKSLHATETRVKHWPDGPPDSYADFDQDCQCMFLSVYQLLCYIASSKFSSTRTFILTKATPKNSLQIGEKHLCAKTTKYHSQSQVIFNWYASKNY